MIEVMEEEKIKENELEVGDYESKGMEKMEKKNGMIGNVRGRGMFLGEEIVIDREEKNKEEEMEKRVVKEMRERGVMMKKIGIKKKEKKIRKKMKF